MKLRPSPALIVASIALLIALGGTGYAAFKVPKNSVGSKQLKNNAVTTKKLKNGAVTSAKIAGNAVTTSQIADNAVTASKLNVTLPAASALTLGGNWVAPTDGEPSLACYEDREGIVHFVGAAHSNPGAMPLMATLPSSCPPPPTALTVQAMGNVGTSVSSTNGIPITINADGTLTNSTGTAGTPNNNLTMESITYRAR